MSCHVMWGIPMHHCLLQLHRAMIDKPPTLGSYQLERITGFVHVLQLMGDELQMAINCSVDQCGHYSLVSYTAQCS